MKVYTVSYSVEYEGEFLEWICSTEEAAKAWVEKQKRPDRWIVEEREVQETKD